MKSHTYKKVVKGKKNKASKEINLEKHLCFKGQEQEEHPSKKET